MREAKEREARGGRGRREGWAWLRLVGTGFRKGRPRFVILFLSMASTQHKLFQFKLVLLGEAAVGSPPPAPFPPPLQS